MTQHLTQLLPRRGTMIKPVEQGGVKLRPVATRRQIGIVADSAAQISRQTL